ncbi:hypothetical protein [Aquibium oceanicum]|uniref:Uncharacterized protein n=1 Tax=Aquibium oceanicum TaxID=1670800 RepID=A0A1L3SNY2_9HYPH|nr:hypothetical protein [Aquibium oceanicum]APH71119.1 hypothetical protein BSQ44_06850 [Aquibium oceanicum]
MTDFDEALGVFGTVATERADRGQGRRLDSEWARMQRERDAAVQSERARLVKDETMQVPDHE